jgi:hypothetical protein
MHTHALQALLCPLVPIGFIGAHFTTFILANILGVLLTFHNVIIHPITYCKNLAFPP